MSYILNEKDITKHETVQRGDFRITTTVYGNKAVFIQVYCNGSYTTQTVFLEDGKA